MPKSKIKIALIPGGPNVYFAPWAEAAKAESKALGVTVSYIVPPTPTFEPSVEMSTIKSLVAKGYNAFAIFPDGEASIIPLYNRLKARGIPVIDIAGCTSDPTPALLCFAHKRRGFRQIRDGGADKGDGRQRGISHSSPGC